MQPINITIPHIPQPKARARRGANGRFYTPISTKVFENMIATYSKLEKNKQKFKMIIDKPVFLQVNFFLPIPISRIKKIKEGDLHIIAPDTSNLIKAIEDGMNKIIYKDDCQISKITTEKRYSSNPRVEIYVSEID